MRCLIGIDGGGTKTHCLATDLEGNFLYECTGGPSNLLIQGAERVSETIFSLIDNCKKRLNLDYNDIKVIVLGTSGAGRKPDADRMEKAFAEYSFKQGVEFNFFKVESDAAIALEGAFGGKAGSILIAGTGSILFCKDDSGRICRIGGFGKLLGDEGGGFSLGRKGLSALSKELDGRLDKSALLDIAQKKYGINSPEKLIEEVYANKLDIASFAPLVLEAAEEGDLEALKIINDETEELVLHILAMEKKAGISALNVALVGGLINKDNIYSRLLRKKMHLEIPDVNIVEPEYSPAMGAILIARRLLTNHFM